MEQHQDFLALIFPEGMSTNNGHSIGNDLLRQLKDGGAAATTAFNLLYDQYSEALIGFVYARVRDREVSEDIVQEIFVSIWNRRDDLPSDVTSVEAYLYQSARYRIFSYYRSENVRKEYARYFTDFLLERCEDTTHEWIALNEARELIERVLSQLPQRCRTAFRLSRFENLSITQIAEQMNVSSRAVENYLTCALKELRLVLRASER